jgi:DNA-binding NarL/FixJ family response regulator
LDLALIDLGLPDGSGIDLLARLRDRRPEILCIVTTIYDDDAHLFPALSAGAAGYLLKEQGPEALTLHLRALAQGIPALSPRVARRMLAHFQRQSSPEPVEVPRDALLSSPSGRGAGQPGALTRRETEVLSLIARGLQRGEAARVLGVSENTVAKFIKDIYRKLNISSRAEAALEASRRGLL